MNKYFTIALTDDDADEHLLFKLTLDSIDPTVYLKSYKGGKELLQALQVEELPNVIFIDINMPLLNGFETIKRIRKISSLKQLPVVVISASANPDDVKTAYDCGADLYLN